MKKLLILINVLLYSIVLSQTAKEIIDKNIEASGGINQWKLLNSVLLQGKVTLGIKDEYPIIIYQQRPNLTKTVIMMNKKETTIEGYDGKNGYGMNYANNKLQMYKDYVPENFDNDFIDWESKGFEAKFLGKEKIEECLCFKIELTKNVNRTLYFFDSKTYMLIKEVKKDEILQYSDYMKVGNLFFPMRIESNSPKKDGDYVITLKKIEINKVFPASTFKF